MTTDEWFTQLKYEAFIFLLDFDGEPANDDKVLEMVSLVNDWDNRVQVDITPEIKREIEAVKEWKEAEKLKRLLNLK